MQRPKLRDGKKLLTPEIYPLNVFSKELIRHIGGYFVYLLYIGRKDMTGSDFGDAFAEAIGGIHFDSPLGIADVELGNCCWSTKTVKSQNKSPFNSKALRIISGRCSPDYSFEIKDLHKDYQKTGESVLKIWNARVDIAFEKYTQVRTVILVRSPDLQSGLLFEEDTTHYKINDYYWKLNKGNNLEGYDENHNKRFTWQFSGSQFTIHYPVPASATKFAIQLPSLKLSSKDVLEMIKFDDSWVKIL